MKALIITLMMFGGTFAMAQSGTESDAPKVNFFHQIFMDDTIQSVQKVIYNDDSTAISFKLSDDKTAIYLMNYAGKRSVHAFYTDKSGAPKDVKKSPCQVQDLRVEL